MDLIHVAGETIVGFIPESCGDNPLYASAAGSISKESWVNSVAGNDSERVWNFHEARLTMERCLCQAAAIEIPPFLTEIPKTKSQRIEKGQKSETPSSALRSGGLKPPTYLKRRSNRCPLGG